MRQFLALALVLVAVTASASFTFDTYALGDLNGQYGWVSTGTNVVTPGIFGAGQSISGGNAQHLLSESVAPGDQLFFNYYLCLPVGFQNPLPLGQSRSTSISFDFSSGAGFFSLIAAITQSGPGSPLFSISLQGPSENETFSQSIGLAEGNPNWHNFDIEYHPDGGFIDVELNGDAPLTDGRRFPGFGGPYELTRVIIESHASGTTPLGVFYDSVAIGSGPVPEPATLVAMGALSAGFLRRRRR